jgi:hypothetical protein
MVAAKWAIVGLIGPVESYAESIPEQKKIPTISGETQQHNADKAS